MGYDLLDCHSPDRFASDFEAEQDGTDRVASDTEEEQDHGADRFASDNEEDQDGTESGMDSSDYSVAAPEFEELISDNNSVY